MRYLNGTVDYGLVYKDNSMIEGFSDADWAFVMTAFVEIWYYYLSHLSSFMLFQKCLLGILHQIGKEK